MWVRKPLHHNRHTKQEGRTDSITILSSQFPGIEMPEWTKVMWKIKQLVLQLGDQSQFQKGSDFGLSEQVRSPCT